MNVRKRIETLRQLAEKGTALLITSQRDISYYTGYQLTGDDRAYLVVNRRQATLWVSPLNNDAVRCNQVTVKFLTARPFSSLKGKTVCYDEYHVPAALFLRLKKMGLRLRPAAALITQPRMTKDSEEIALMKKGIAINRKILGRLDVEGKTEQQVAQEIEIGFLQAGAQKSFETIVASGKNSAFIHYRPRVRRIGRNDLVVIDFGARVQYCTDMTRTVCLRPGRRERQLMENIAAIQQKVIDAIHAGMPMGELNEIYEKEMNRKGYPVMHGVGHGVGLDVHERPGRYDRLEKGMVITVEPGAYLKGFGGCRIEDMVLVKNKPVVLSQNRDNSFC